MKADQIRYAWKDKNGKICQTQIAGSKDELFEMSGFSVVDVDKPIKGCLAVRVEYTNYGWLEYYE